MKLDLNLEGASVKSARVVVPTGNYPVEVTSAVIKETKKKGGYFLETSFKILAGDNAGVVLIDRYNIVNENKTAQDIGYDNLKTVLTVAGFANPNFIKDTNDMVGLKLNLYVEENDHSFKNDKGDSIDTTQNEIKSYFPLDMEKTVTAPATTKTVSAPAPTAVAAPVAQETAAPVQTETAPEASAFPWMK